MSSILLSKTFDNGVICASEQSVVIVSSVYDKVRAEFAKRGAWFLNEEEKAKVGAVCMCVPVQVGVMRTCVRVCLFRCARTCVWWLMHLGDCM